MYDKKVISVPEYQRRVNNYVSISNKTNPRRLQFFTIFGIFRKIYNIPIGLNIVLPKVGHFFQLAKFPSHILLIFEYIREISHTPIVFPCAKTHRSNHETTPGIQLVRKQQLHTHEANHRKHPVCRRVSITHEIGRDKRMRFVDGKRDCPRNHYVANSFSSSSSIQMSTRNQCRTTFSM